MLKRSKGFSLIEILISLVLFASLSLSMMNVLKQTTKAQNQIERLIKQNRILANTSYAIRKDLQNPLMIQTDSPHQAYYAYWNYLRDPKWNNGKIESDFITDYLEDDGYYKRNIIFPFTGFKGEKQSFYFTNTRPRLKTAYVLEDCPASNAQCLFRKTAPIDNRDLDEFPESETEKTSLLEGVVQLEIQYLHAKNKEWTHTFQMKHPANFYTFPLTFPLAVKMEIELENSEPFTLSIPIYPSLLSHKIHNPKRIADPPKEEVKNPPNSNSRTQQR